MIDHSMGNALRHEHKLRRIGLVYFVADDSS
jgi:hypothetical protein